MRIIKFFLWHLGILGLVLILVPTSVYGEDRTKPSKGSTYVLVGAKESVFAPYGSDNQTQLIMKRNDLQDEGSQLAKRGLYDQAIEKYQDALRCASKTGFDRNTALGSIRDIHRLQGKFELALKEQEYFLKQSPNFPHNIDLKLQLEALIKARDTKSNQPVYDHISYLKNKYKKDLTGEGFASGGYATGIVSDIIHLYDYVSDAEAGIAFMNETLGYLKKHRFSQSFRFAIAEYERVKAALEEDKRTGQKGHLQKVIETSDYIGW